LLLQRKVFSLATKRSIDKKNAFVVLILTNDFVGVT